MKTIKFLVAIFLTAMATCRAQDEIISTNGVWLNIDAAPSLGLTNSVADDGSQTEQVMANIQPQTPPTPPAYAEATNSEIQALADGLQDDPLKLCNYVHDHIRHSLYFGSRKGAELTLLERSGNDFDQCALLVALLRAAGYGDAGYQFGWMLLPYDSTDGSDRDIHHWLKLDLTNSPSTWSTTTSFLDSLFKTRDYPTTAHQWGNNVYAIQRVWVTVTVDGTSYSLDPSFKVTERISGVDLPSAMGFSVSGLSNAVGGLSVGNPSTVFYATNLNESGLRGKLADYTKNLLNCIQSNYPNASVEQILSGEYVVPSTNTSLANNLLFSPTNLNGTMPPISWINEPTNMMSTLSITFCGKKYQWFGPQLQGQRLSLTASGSGLMQLWLDDVPVASGNTGGGTGTTNVTITTYYPGFSSSWNASQNTFAPGAPGQYWETTSKGYLKANATYAISYAYEPDWAWLQQRQKKLDAYRQQYPDTSRQVVSETLNIMALNWQLQVEAVEQALARQIGVSPAFYHRIGRMSQETGYGYYVDVYMAWAQSTSTSYQYDDHVGRWIDLIGYFGSAMEHGLIEQLQNANLKGASTVKILELANTNHQAIYFADGTNWTTVSGKLVNYSASSLSTIAWYIGQGYNALLPQNGKTQIAGTGSWTGYGLLVRYPLGGIGMLIGDNNGIHSGGYVSDLSATVSPSWINYSAYSQPLYFSSSPVSVPTLTGADPVNMADGTFQVQATDLSLGQTEPRGLSFSRYYNSNRRNSNLAGIAPGWLHNYYLNAANISSPQAGLGGTTPAQMASMMVAVTAATAFYQGSPSDPKNWMTTDLIAKWGIDQLTAKAVSISLGKDTVQFIKQPDGSFTPPANCTMSLSQTNAAYWLQERHGRAYQFNGGGWCTNIVDQYNQALSLTYGTSNLVSTVTDWKRRTLAFVYSSSAPVQLQTVTDSAGRKVSLGYSSRNDLNSVVDPEGSTSTFGYDTNHQITATFNALSQMVASNIYNSFGRVTTQYTGGNTNRAWRIFWSGWQTISQDPAGASETYFYDDKTRTIGQSDALGNLTQKFYDGQDHVVMAVTPLGETNQFIFDGNHNLLATVDPLGYSNQFFYDGQNNLTQALDANQHPTTYGYNAQFSMTGQTNAMGDWVSLVYNTADGTLHSRSDSAGTTFFGYDAYGQVNSVTYPGSLGGESMVNNAYGDATNHVDARGFATAFQFNNRRQLTNTIAPTNIMVKIKLDAVGNVAATTDPRGNVTSNLWSVTQHLLKTTLPALPQGTPSITNIYDNRDLLVQTFDALANSMVCTNDLAGRTVSVTDSLKRTTRFAFDADGRALATANAANETNRQTWDARGRKAQTIDGAGHSSQRVYDGVGNVVTLTNRNNNPWQFHYDAANRLTTTTSPLGKSSSATYNHQGLPNSVTDPMQQPTSLYYDALGRLTNRTDNVGTALYSLDANGNLTTVIENNQTNSWTYDAYNRVSSYADVYGNLIQYRFDPNGNLTNLIYPGNRTVTYAFDSQNHLTNVTDWSGRKTSIGYNLAGHVTSIIHPNGSFRTMGYDSAGQMTNIMEQMSNSLPIAIFRFGWTNTGNLAWEFAAPEPHSATVPTRTMTYDTDNRLKTVDGNNVVMDDDGNLTSGPLTNDTAATYVYDARNRLTSVGGVTNIYDSSGNRIGLNYGTNRTVFVVNPNAALPEVLMRIKNGATNYYVYGPGLLYQVTETATRTNTLTYHYDYRGSTVALSADSGLVTDRIEYAAYGLTTYRAGTNDTPFLFNGRYGVMSDPNGLLAMNARYYNPFLCRFISSDPSGFSGGLNWYAFANGNPIGFIDPFGLGAVSESTVDLSWFNAPTPAEQETQNALASFVNFATMGVADLAAKTFQGTDIYGNQVSPEAQNEAAINLGAMVAGLALGAAADGLAVEAAESASASIARTAEGGAANSTLWVVREGTPDSVINAASEKAMATLDRYGVTPRFSSTSSDFARAAYTRFDQAKSMTLFPEADELTLIEEAHHVETAVNKGWWGEQIESLAQKRTREAYLESEWEKYAESIGLMKK
ncbi:MAG: RHS repeat-associated core domain-containing protein [Negativicutes bacterium]|nr:RHS repeat-associated core domain-containing protein [Negativicutes bacterium]